MDKEYKVELTKRQCSIVIAALKRDIEYENKNMEAVERLFQEDKCDQAADLKNMIDLNKRDLKELIRIFSDALID